MASSDEKCARSAAGAILTRAASVGRETSDRSDPSSMAAAAPKTRRWVCVMRACGSRRRMTSATVELDMCPVYPTGSWFAIDAVKFLGTANFWNHQVAAHSRRRECAATWWFQKLAVPRNLTASIANHEPVG